MGTQLTLDNSERGRGSVLKLCIIAALMIPVTLSSTYPLLGTRSELDPDDWISAEQDPPSPLRIVCSQELREFIKAELGDFDERTSSALVLTASHEKGRSSR